MDFLTSLVPFGEVLFETNGKSYRVDHLDHTGYGYSLREALDSLASKLLSSRLKQ